jgi:hypothetical protein
MDAVLAAGHYDLTTPDGAAALAELGLVPTRTLAPAPKAGASLDGAPTLLIDETGIALDGERLLEPTALHRPSAFRRLHSRLLRAQAAKPGRLLLLRATSATAMKCVNRTQAAAWAAGFVAVVFAAKQ